MKTKSTGIPLVGQPRGTEQAGVDLGRKQEPPEALHRRPVISCSTFPGCISLATAAAMYTVSSLCFSDTMPLGTLFPGSPPILDI